MPHSEAKVAGRKVLVLYKLLICLVNLREKEREDEDDVLYTHNTHKHRYKFP